MDVLVGCWLCVWGAVLVAQRPVRNVRVCMYVSKHKHACQH
jgi:hypothetical protein